MNLLVVDDDSITRMTLRTLLISEGYSVLVASDGDEAIKAISETPVDLVISDVYMPRVDGIRLRNIVRDLDGFSELPFIFISGYDDKATLESVTEPKIEGFFRKGRPLTELLAWIKYLTTPLEKRPLSPPGVNGRATTRQDLHSKESRYERRTPIV